ncbi:hypothetical protein ACP70R_003177 [Stipagrostis hirtigluma subsp. patula]
MSTGTGGGEGRTGKKKKKETKLGLAFIKDGSFGEWYADVVVKGELIKYYDGVSGCYVLRPSAMKTWSLLRDFFDALISTCSGFFK